MKCVHLFVQCVHLFVKYVHLFVKCVHLFMKCVHLFVKYVYFLMKYPVIHGKNSCSFQYHLFYLVKFAKLSGKLFLDWKKKTKKTVSLQHKYLGYLVQLVLSDSQIKLWQYLIIIGVK